MDGIKAQSLIRAFENKERNREINVPEDIKKDQPPRKLVPKGSLEDVRHKVDKSEQERSSYINALNKIKNQKREKVIAPNLDR